MSDGGKGSSPRPYSVDQKTFSENWDNIFKKKHPREIDDAIAEDEAFKIIEELVKERTKINLPNK
jgi:hypothetical protein